jgi:hypothetical protein
VADSITFTLNGAAFEQVTITRITIRCLIAGLWLVAVVSNTVRRK